MTRVLVTGGLGYIGSHVCVELLNRGISVVALDNLTNSKKEVVDSIMSLKQHPSSEFDWLRGDVLDNQILALLMNRFYFDATMHFAGLKSVAESVRSPLNYYRNNVQGTINLLTQMDRWNMGKTFIFSSSATVYAAGPDPRFQKYSHVAPFSEVDLAYPSTPYGDTKFAVENMLNNLGNQWKVCNLRYFNPIGAHRSGRLGENPVGAPNNLMPIIANVVAGQQIAKVVTTKQDVLKIYGNDYETRDGTAQRDYIDVEDLAVGHCQALHYMETKTGGLRSTFNLGTGKPTSVLQLVTLADKIAKEKLGYERGVPFEFAPRRDGDVASLWADPYEAMHTLKWTLTRSLESSVESALRYRLQKFL